MTSSTANEDESWYAPVPSIAPLVSRVRSVAASRRTHSLGWRRSQLRAILNLLSDHRSDIAAALHADLGQPEQYVEIFELATTVNLAQFALDHLDEWTRTERVPTPFPTNMTQPVHSEITAYPRGVVLIMCPWNFPLTLLLAPLINAVSAGNACVLKPSEISVHTSRLLVKLVGEYCDSEAIAVVPGGAEQATELLRHRFDAISYTGGVRVARIVAAAAAKHLTPTLLELGGKTPAIVCPDADVQSAAYRIAWGKFAGNMGQFCINTDYVLVVESLRDEFVATLKRVLVEFYGDDPRRCKDVGRMITVEHAKRVVGLVDDTCTVLHGGTRHDVEERYVEPTIVEAHGAESTIMQEEIFGPVLAILTVPDVDAAIEFVNVNFNSKGNHPLSLYVFARSKANQRKVMDRIQSGMCCVNHVILNGGNFHLPFGGVGQSGMGSYYGKHGFDFFSHRRGALVSNNFNSSRVTDPGNWISFPPYNDRKLAVFRFVAKVPGMMGTVAWALKVSAPVVFAAVVYQNPGLVAAAREFNINTIIGWISNLVS